MSTMSTISAQGKSPVDTQVLDQLGLSKLNEKTMSESEQQRHDFLKLFMAQMKNQDPMSPQEGSEMVAQLAQFSTVEGVQNLNKSFENFSNTMQSTQTIQATSLIGKKVQVPSQYGTVSKIGEGFQGSVELPSSVADLRINIESMDGSTLHTMNLGSQASGELEFDWDGTNTQGEQVAPGNYRVRAQAMIDGETQSFETSLYAPVHSVAINRKENSISLHVDGFGQLALSDVKKISDK